jgi:ribonuclease VapC
MIIDSSALVAILRAEPDREVYLRAIVKSQQRMIAAPTVLETTMVLAGGREAGILEQLDAFILQSRLQILPFTATHAAVAREAFLRYGKGRHPAALNFGDCIAYATARLEGLPLLFKGDDFRRTDIAPALPPP